MIFSEWGFTPFCFDHETVCLDNFSPLKPDLVILGSLSVAGISRMVHAIRLVDHRMPVLVMSDHPDVVDSITANGFASVTVLPESTTPSQIQTILNKLITQERLSELVKPMHQIIGNNHRMIQIKKMILDLGDSSETVLLSGQNGTGKELTARTIHSRSSRTRKPFVKIDCSALNGIPSYLAADEDTLHKSLFGGADTGTLFLHEIGNVPAAFQNELLLLVEEGVISKPGSRTKQKVDIRILASCTTDLSRIMENGDFRKDLFFRLNVFTIDMPALKDRTDDIPLLMDFFADKYCLETGRSHYNILPENKSRFSSYSWPGNTAELETQVKHAVMRDNRVWRIEESLISAPNNKYGYLRAALDDIEIFAELPEVKQYIDDIDNISLKDIGREFVLRTEKKLMRFALEHTRWNRTKAAQILNISYKSLLNKIKAYHLTQKVEY